MKTIHKQLKLDPHIMDLLEIENPESVLLLDIETTGFTAKTGMIYLIACIYVRDNQVHFVQWLCEHEFEEARLLSHFHEFAHEFDLLLHYNGTNFDMPFIAGRMARFELMDQVTSRPALDLYLMVRPFQKYLPVPNLKLKSLEKLFGFEREDPYDGGQLIQTFKSYTQTGNQELENALLLHNEEDLIGLYLSLQILRHTHLLQHLMESAPPASMTCKLKPDHLSLRFNYTSALHMSYENEWVQFVITEHRVELKLRLVQDELCYYFDNHKDYYYLPDEDTAIHKSIAQFVDASAKVKATKATACIKKRGTFIPLPKNFDIEGIKKFRYADNSKQYFCEWSVDINASQDQLDALYQGWMKQL